LIVDDRLNFKHSNAENDGRYIND